MALVFGTVTVLGVHPSSYPVCGAGRLCFVFQSRSWKASNSRRIIIEAQLQSIRFASQDDRQGSGAFADCITAPARARASSATISCVSLFQMAAQMVMNSVATSHLWRLNAPKLSSSRIVVSPASRCFLCATSQARRAGTTFTVAATSNEGGETKDSVTSSTSTSVTEDKETSPAAQNSISEKRAKAEAEVKKGQRTAIVTGAISVLLGVGYLVLIQLLDTRGVILVPPPPEAFNP